MKPYASAFSDYHDIDYEALQLTKRARKQVKGYEVGYIEDVGYIGLFYQGRRPDHKKIVYLLKKMLGDERIDKEVYGDLVPLLPTFAKGGGSIYYDEDGPYVG